MKNDMQEDLDPIGTEPGTGAILDTRPESEKQNDNQFKEIVASASPVNWLEKQASMWRKFPDQNQGQSNSCVAQTIKKMAGINVWLKENSYIPFSATYIYQQRSNKPAPGMNGVESFEIWKRGITLEQLVPSEKMNDIEMDNEKVEKYEKDIADIFRLSNHIGLTNGDFDTVASVIQTTGKGVMVWFYFLSDEWSLQIPSIRYPNLNLNSPSTLRHSVCAVDYFLYGGVQYLLVEDSAHFGGITRRLITRDFFTKRNFFSRYPMNFVFQDPNIPIPTPHYIFTKNLAFDQTNTDIKNLQDILKFEGLFPTNTASTGYYGAITAKGVLAFQKRYKVDLDANLDLLQGRQVGPKTIIKLNSIYGI